MNEITIPKKLDLIVKAFFAESPQVAKALIVQAAKAIYGSDEDDAFTCMTRKKHLITNEELEDLCAFMQGFQPKDMIEALLSAQVVVSHMLGMRKIAKSHFTDQHIGLKLLRFSSDSICLLQKKRSGGMQNITVNYNYGSKQQTIPLEIPV